MNATTNTVIVDPVPSDYLAIGGDAEEANVQPELFKTGQAALRSAPQSRRAVWLRADAAGPDRTGCDVPRTPQTSLGVNDGENRGATTSTRCVSREAVIPPDHRPRNPYRDRS